MNAAIPQQQLERELLLMLTRQWQIEKDLLPTALAQSLRRPQMAFDSLEKRWAHWDSNARCIVFSRTLLTYPWPSLRAILRHEMGHQLADTCLEGMQQTPHGPAFQTACELLKTEATANVDHPEYIEHKNDTEDDRHLRRVRKLLALAGGCNQHEAEAAMTKAHHLIRRHHLNLFGTSTPPAYVSRCLGQPVSRRPRYHYALANLLQDHYFVATIWIFCSLPTREKPGSILEISGTANDVELAAYVYDFVLLHLEKLWNEYRKTNHVSGHRKTDFALGLIAGFTEKLNASKPPEATHETALLSLADKRLTTYQKQRYPRIRTIQRGAKTDHGVLKDGHQRGRNLVLQRGIHQHKGHSGRHLPSRGS